MTTCVLEIALPGPLQQCYDYLPPQGLSPLLLQPGCRLTVPFGRRSATGILLRVKADASIPLEQLKPALSLLDPQPLLGPQLIALLQWAARYYFAGPGEALFHALPPPLRKGRAVTARGATSWRLTRRGLGLGDNAFRNAPRQQQAWRYLLDRQCIAPTELTSQGISRAALNQLVAKQFAEKVTLAPTAGPPGAPAARGPHLNAAQRTAVDTLRAALGQYRAFLLDGVTGSGKTEVYLQLISTVISRGQQALVLVPEIGLTPQTISRFKSRLGEGVVALHSQLSDGERSGAWQAARLGQASVVIGTRSAVLNPFHALGLIVVDEEHDPSYKQQHGFRYSARDVAVKRAQLEGIPVILGSATPAAETLHNAHTGRYQAIALPFRAGEAEPPTFQLVDQRAETLREGFCTQTLEAISRTIAAGNQALVFINRRGFAPTLICHLCGWTAECRHCDARLVIHRKQIHLRCHHCDTRQALPERCPNCANPQLEALGQGTQRSEAFLQDHYSGVPVLRIDRDSTGNRGALDAMISRVRDGGAAILVGTQMLAKGHHFPDVTLVAVIDADTGLCSADFRGPERTAQMLTQVAGRAGRASKPGAVLIQTHNPEHPLLRLLQQDHYRAISELLLAERERLGLPPFGHLAAILCDGSDPERLERLLQQLAAQLRGRDGLVLIGPLPPPVARRADRFRCHLLLKHAQRGALHHALARATQWLRQQPRTSALRWCVDVDPQDVF